MLQRNSPIFRAVNPLLLIACTCVAGVGQAQDLEIAISPSPVGAGARAAGMADAFVAVADDATAASWNPAGLVQLERPEFSIVGSYNALKERFSASDHDEVDSRHSDSNLDLNYLSVVYPVPFLVLGRNLTVSMNYQRKYDFSRNFDLDFDRVITDAGGGMRAIDLDFNQEGGLATLTPAFALELTHRLSIGVSFNFWRSSFLSDNSWDQTTLTHDAISIGALGLDERSRLLTVEDYEDFRAENVSIGLLWNFKRKWTFGIRYDTRTKGSVDYQSTETRITTSGGVTSAPTETLIDTRRQIQIPATLTLGAAYRANDSLTLSFDISRTDWNDFWVKQADGSRISLVNASNFDDPSERTKFDPTTTVRFGAEYIFLPSDEKMNQIWTLRGGLFYDQEPASGNPDDFYGFTLGLGFLAHQRANIDVAYQLRYGHDVNHDLIRGLADFSENVYQQRILVSSVIYF